MEVKDKIVDLSAKWYKYVGLDHHKDGDCHWGIDIDYAYGELPTYTANHYGYITDNPCGLDRDNLQTAEVDLLKLLQKAIAKEKEWCERVLATPGDWDEIQEQKANKFFKIFV